jgi:hypothetical protein
MMPNHPRCPLFPLANGPAPIIGLKVIIGASLLRQSLRLLGFCLDDCIVELLHKPLLGILS